MNSLLRIWNYTYHILIITAVDLHVKLSSKLKGKGIAGMKLKRKLSKKKIVVIVAIVCVIGTGGVIFFKTQHVDKKIVSDANEIFILSKMDLKNKLSMTGVVTSGNQTLISSEISDVIVSELNVKSGQSVKVGDVICRFDTKALDQKITDLKKEIAAMKEKQKQTVSSANSAYETAKQQAVLLTERSKEDMDALNNKVNDAKAAAENAKTKFDQISQKYSAADSIYQAALLSVTQTEEAYNQAVQARTKSEREYQDAAISAESTIREKNDSVKSAGATDSELTAKETELAKLENTKTQSTILATTDGVISGVEVKQGEVFKGGQIALITATDKLSVTASADQTQVASIKSGMKATVKFNATGDKEFTGKVTFVSAVPKSTETTSGTGTSTGTSPEYEVFIQLDQTTEDLRLGMTAKTEAVISEVNGVYAVPSECIKGNADTGFYVFTQKNGELGQINVTKGFENDYYTEIKGKELTENLEIIR